MFIMYTYEVCVLRDATVCAPFPGIHNVANNAYNINVETKKQNVHLTSFDGVKLHVFFFLEVLRGCLSFLRYTVCVNVVCNENVIY